MFRVRIQNDGGQELASFALADAPHPRHQLLIGRAEDCDLRLKHGAVSRHHCRLVRDEDGDWLLRDLGSTMGTVVEDARICEIVIRDGLMARIGPAVLRFEALAAASGADAAKPAASSET